MSAQVESVNVGRTVDVPWGKLGRSAIDKRPVAGPVHIGPAGLAGDEIADQVFHGGPDQAVYAYSAEDLQTWSHELGRTLVPGQFGENLTTSGIDLTQARAGDRWRVGGALLEIAGVRIPCSVFQGFLDEPQWVRRFTLGHMPGPYLRVLEPGEVMTGDAIEVVERRDHDITVELLFRALTTERALIASLAAEPRIDSFVARRLGERRNDRPK
ncbi:MOSC domain-containing protein [Aeromicrobium fastidiosum]|uniref:MOSC domain-containing protein n=1 Tax=Aeromicrobium fastidiosum TaxID=52699 RepID=A0A641AQA8_9ACTN|nr:MOSC domain-containing protein [Aeromicrobium fastidiosum]KAA1378435.1 MOSC domain-containing protein [Aeromicrobium fastidiosum]MBP2392601.1 MOSC domain-containing protein YiiM [Aeromicrobium fastidiosum]